MSGNGGYLLKGRFCVSTVSTVRGRALGSMVVVSAAPMGPGGGWLDRGVVIDIADDADGADGIFRPRMDP